MREHHIVMVLMSASLTMFCAGAMAGGVGLFYTSGRPQPEFAGNEIRAAVFVLRISGKAHASPALLLSVIKNPLLFQRQPNGHGIGVVHVQNGEVPSERRTLDFINSSSRPTCR